MDLVVAHDDPLGEEDEDGDQGADDHQEPAKNYRLYSFIITYRFFLGKRTVETGKEIWNELYCKYPFFFFK